MNKNKFAVNLFLGFVKLTGIIPALIFLKPKVYLEKGAKRRLPAPSILVSNHMSLIDFVLYLCVFPFRTIRFLMAEVLYNKSKLFAKFLGLIGGIRVDRDAFDFSFVSDCIEVLDNKGTLGIFPQGRLPIGDKPFPFTVSTAFIAKNADALIVPVYTDGNYGLFKRASVVIGEPFDLKDYIVKGESEEESLKRLTGILEEKVYALKSQIEKRK